MGIGDKKSMDVKRICGTCTYHRPDENDNWVCTCVDSDLCGIETEYDYSCMEYDSR